MSADFRSSVMQKINELQLRGNLLTFARQTEEDYFQNSQTPDEYVARVVELVRELKKKNDQPNAHHRSQVVEKTIVPTTGKKTKEKRVRKVAPEKAVPKQDDQVYAQKVRKLTLYLPALKKIIKSSTGDRKIKAEKFKVFIEAVSTTDSRVGIEKLENSERYMTTELQLNKLNPLVTAIHNSIDDPLPFQLTFLPCTVLDVDNLFGIRKIPLPKRETVPQAMAGEMASILLNREITSLGRQFKVKIDTASLVVDEGQINLVCSLENEILPALPPIYVTIANDYPHSRPECSLLREEYCGTKFLQDVQALMESKMQHLMPLYTLSQVLGVWENSVKTCCQ